MIIRKAPEPDGGGECNTTHYHSDQTKDRFYHFYRFYRFFDGGAISMNSMKKSVGRCRVLVVAPGEPPIVMAKTDRMLAQCIREEYRGYLVPLLPLRRTWVLIPGGPRCPASKRDQIIREARRWWSETRHKWTSTPQLGRVYPRRARRPKMVAHGWGRVEPVGCAAVRSEQSRFVERQDFQMSKGV